MPDYIVKQGDSIASIAYNRDLFWETIWEHPKNAKLKEQRGNPNILKPGDRVFVPEKEAKPESCTTDQRHRFRRKGVPEKLKIRILIEEPSEDQSQEISSSQQDHIASNLKGQEFQGPARYKPRAKVPYVLEIDGNLSNGTTDNEGYVEYSILPNARKGHLILEPGTPNEWIVELNVGYLNPISEISGVKQRLNSLGLECGEFDEQETQELEQALCSFQRKHGLRIRGGLDEQTKQKLKELHIS
jgi:hypothetical protein